MIRYDGNLQCRYSTVHANLMNKCEREKASSSSSSLDCAVGLDRGEQLMVVDWLIDGWIVREGGAFRFLVRNLRYHMYSYSTVWYYMLTTCWDYWYANSRGAS